AAQKAGVGAMGFFSALIAEQSPFVLALISYPSLAAMATAMDKIASDQTFQKGFDEYNSAAELPYIRMESSLLRAFPGQPSLTVPAGDAKRAARVFELRSYESNNLKASQRKIRMFDEGEAAIFQRLGMSPVFFGETIVGRNLP